MHLGRKYGLESYLNPSSSPDLSPIENWFKQAIRKTPRWADAGMRAVIDDDGVNVSGKFVKERADAMPDRF